MAAPTIDTSRFPLVLVRISGYLTEGEFDVYLESLTRLVERNEKMLTILDARGALRNPQSQRQKQADWMKTHQSWLRRYSLGTAFVITSPLVRGVLTAIFWLQPIPTDYTIVSTLDEAEQWAAKRLKEAGLAAPAPSERPPLTKL